MRWHTGARQVATCIAYVNLTKATDDPSVETQFAVCANEKSISSARFCVRIVRMHVQHSSLYVYVYVVE